MLCPVNGFYSHTLGLLLALVVALAGCGDANDTPAVCDNAIGTWAINHVTTNGGTCDDEGDESHTTPGLNLQLAADGRATWRGRRSGGDMACAADFAACPFEVTCPLPDDGDGCSALLIYRAVTRGTNIDGTLEATITCGVQSCIGYGEFSGALIHR